MDSTSDDELSGTPAALHATQSQPGSGHAARVLSRPPATASVWPRRPRPHEVAVEAAVSLPISDSSCACLVLLIDEGSVADGFSDISDDAHGYEAEEEEDDHAPLAKTRNSQLIRSRILRI